MDFRKYQKEAKLTTQSPKVRDNEEFAKRIIPLLGLAGETGELLSEYKKHLRDGDSHKLFKERIEEELGDLLWYISDLATSFELDLNKIAKSNLKKVKDRWLNNQSANTNYYFDKKFSENERLPRKFEITIKEIEKDGLPLVRCFQDGKQIGNDLTDNSHYPDGYRYHDVFHLAYVAILGWSPVARSILDRKRKSDSKIDEVEDGGRAIAIEEGVTALIFSYAEAHNYFKDISELDYSLLKTVIFMTAGLEVKDCSIGDWEKAILSGYDVWRQICENRGGIIIGDSDNQTIFYKEL